MDYDFRKIEKSWQAEWQKQNSYQVKLHKDKPKYYVLDMFPYPSGAGLHVGHPLGYIASDIFSRYKRLKGFNVLHPMGFDAFGLPAEQYAVETGQHPAVTTANNIKRYKEQLGAMGFCYDWMREVQTSDPRYYKWTQWIFLKLFNAWYNKDTDSAELIETLIEKFEKEGNINVNTDDSDVKAFTADDWKAMPESEQHKILLNYRLAYQANTDVNWCPALGTVLANDEVKDGVSERGGHPVVKKAMRQWFLRITAYVERLLSELDNLDWSESMKEMQRNWIGRSEGALIQFPIEKNGLTPSPCLAGRQVSKGEDLGGVYFVDVFTTRPDTIFGATFMVLAPEHELLAAITTPERQDAVSKYLKYAENRSERDRLSEVKKITGEFTGAYAVNPFTEKKIPIWVAEYVLADYGTGAIMAVPAHDSRDHDFARHFDLPIIQVIGGDDKDITQESYDDKAGKMINSGFINGMEVRNAIRTVIDKAEALGIGERQINYRLRDAAFSRQRYWGEPFPIYYKGDVPYAMDENKLPLELPEIESYKPSEQGGSPLSRAKGWITDEGHPIETDTMPGYAGSSWYFLRYMDPHNDKEFVSKEAEQYWGQVDLYIGGAEHAVGHLMYARFWNHFLYDMGYVSNKEPFKKLVNQGMIQGRSNIAYKIKDSNKFVSKGLKNNYSTMSINVDVNLVKNDVLNIELFKKWREEYKNAEFVLENGKYYCGYEVEKMSKSKYNVVNPDHLIEQYGADTFRMYEMFLGPVEQHKPWNTHGIEGVSRFLHKFWRLFFDEGDALNVSDDQPNNEEQKILHKTIKKVQHDIENLAFNTAVSALMVCVNELGKLKCNKKVVLNNLLIILSPFAPHITEELWHLLGNKNSVMDAAFPEYNDKYMQEDEFEYPVSINGKMRTKIKLPVNLSKEEIEQKVLGIDSLVRWLENKTPKKVIVVPNRIVNIVI